MAENYKGIMGYEPGNDADRMKHYLLENFIEQLLRGQRRIVHYDSHSGAPTYFLGTGELYDGSSRRAVRILDHDASSYHACFNEKNPRLRGALRRFFEGWRDVEVFEDWQESIGRFAKNADRDSFFLFDPSFFQDYCQLNGLNASIDIVLGKGANVMMYYPETKAGKKKPPSESTVELGKVKKMVAANSRECLDVSFSEQSAHREHHYLLVADILALARMQIRIKESRGNGEFKRLKIPADQCSLDMHCELKDAEVLVP